VIEKSFKVMVKSCKSIGHRVYDPASGPLTGGGGQAAFPRNGSQQESSQSQRGALGPEELVLRRQAREQQEEEAQPSGEYTPPRCSPVSHRRAVALTCFCCVVSCSPSGRLPRWWPSRPSPPDPRGSPSSPERLTSARRPHTGTSPKVSQGRRVWTWLIPLYYWYIYRTVSEN